MSEIVTIGLDLAKNVFVASGAFSIQAHGAGASGHPVLRTKLRRDQVLAFFEQLQPCVVAMEACGSAHFWGREIGKLGHEVRLIPCTDAGEESLIGVVEAVPERLGEGPYLDFNRFLGEVEAVAGKRRVRMTAKRQKLLMAELGIKDHAFAEADVISALQTFEEVWAQLFPAEQTRIVQLLVRRVRVVQSLP